jgi:hypothetical protein
MQRSTLLATTFILGGLVWLSSMGVWSHPAYRFGLMVTIFVWCGLVVRTPNRAAKSTGRPTINRTASKRTSRGR